jgi:uncharacterized protein YdhG (YjbR/CyaY superfamily)
MKDERSTPTSIDEYIAGFPGDVQDILEQVRATIRQAAPEAQETISYQIPPFKLKGRYLIYFAGYKEHVGVYPVPAGDDDFNAEISKYRAGKGTLRFRLDRPIPFDLIAKVVQQRAKENDAIAEAKRKKK